jgi:hypothetical protein
MKIVYIAGKFRGPTGWVVAENIRAAERVGIEVARLGFMPLIPHANTAHFDGEMNDDFWLQGTLELLRRCDLIVMVPGWENSTGARGELALAGELKMPIFLSIEDLRLAVVNQKILP